MTCRDFTDFLLEYLSDELAAETRGQFERHLRLCPNCRTYLTSYEETVKLGRRAFDDEDGALPEKVPEELVQAIMAIRRSAGTSGR